MNGEKKPFCTKLDLGILALGIGLPWLLMLIIGLILNPQLLFSKFFYFSSYPTLMFAVCNLLPFLILAELTGSYLFRKSNKSVDVFLLPRLLGTIGAWIVTLILILFLIFRTWISIFHSEHISSVGFGFIGAGILFTIVLIPIGYGFGWLVGRLIIWIK